MLSDITSININIQTKTKEVHKNIENDKAIIGEKKKYKKRNSNPTFPEKSHERICND
jgi:hypothetical protein